MMLVSYSSLHSLDDADPTYFNYVLDVDLKVFGVYVSLFFVRCIAGMLQHWHFACAFNGPTATIET